MQSVVEQGRARMIGLEEIAPSARSYNAGMVDFQGRRLMAYRCQPTSDWKCVIRMVEGGRDTMIDVPAPAKNENLEDPRLFLHAGGLWLAWSAAYYDRRAWSCCQRYGRLEETADGWKVAEWFQPKFGKNDGRKKEKNWQFFESEGGRLFAQYGQSPHHVIELRGYHVVKEFRSPGILWAWGKPSGGTPPAPFAPGLLITFFHAYEFDASFQRRYNFGALVFEDRPPFRQVMQSATPLVVASEADPLPVGEGWRPLCIFPGGAVRDGAEWLVSSGVNDCRIALHRFTDEELQLVRIAEFNTKAPFMKVRVIQSIYSDGEIKTPGSIVELRNDSARELIRRGRVIPVPDGVPFVAEAEPEKPKTARKRARA